MYLRTRDDTMEGAALVAKSGCSFTELLEITCCLGDDTTVESHFDTSCRFSVNGYVKINGIGDFGVRLSVKKMSAEIGRAHV